MARTYGTLYFKNNEWIITDAEPHVCIKLKAIFPKIPKTRVQPFRFSHLPDICHDLHWFTERYPLAISKEDLKRLQAGKKAHISHVNELERILLPNYQPPERLQLENNEVARHYQLQGSEVHMKTKRILIADDIGLGKTLIGILSFLEKGTLPAAVVVQTHLPKQWKEEIEWFTKLRVHIVKTRTPYNLPEADVYIYKYSNISGWTDIFQKGILKSSVFDEVQELRHDDSEKYKAAKVLSSHADYCLGLSATPIFNYGNEIYNVLDVIKPGCLGERKAFLYEWGRGNGSKIIKEPQALGTFLRENFLMLRRTRKEVGRELPPVNTIIHTVGYDEAEVQKAEDIARTLAIKATSGSFVERGQASRELDAFIRHNTGVAKAQSVAEYVKILLDNNEPIILAGWHRDVYDIWLKELVQYNPVMYTGTESPTHKTKSVEAFLKGDTNLFIISLRSGVGLDGLQERCNTVVIGELDFSPSIHLQLIGRIDRAKQEHQVTAIYLVSDCGSDPIIINILGLKASQSHGIINPLISPPQQYTNEDRMTMLAQKYLKKHEAAY